ncbi:MAG: hypothetical protein ABI658_07480 [Acidimicrobiales bacterium]
MKLRRVAIIVIAAALAMSACSSDKLRDAAEASYSPRSTAHPPTTREVATGSTGILRVTQEQTACCYTEGQVSYLTITGPNGAVITDQSFRPLARRAVLYSVPLPPATYEVVSYQRPCDGNCDHLDGPRDRCSSSFDVAPGTIVAVVVRFAPAKGCTLSIDPTVESLIPDDIALVGERRDCGIEYRTASSSPERKCFADAYSAGLPARVVTNTSPNYLDVVRFDNGIITVYRNTPGLAQTSTWTVRTCTGLKPKSDGYELKGCGTFQPL